MLPAIEFYAAKDPRQASQMAWAEILWNQEPEKPSSSLNIIYVWYFVAAMENWVTQLLFAVPKRYKKVDF